LVEVKRLRYVYIFRIANTILDDRSSYEMEIPVSDLSSRAVIASSFGQIHGT
jgi:hypothetical protein